MGVTGKELSFVPRGLVMVSEVVFCTNIPYASSHPACTPATMAID